MSKVPPQFGDSGFEIAQAFDGFVVHVFGSLVCSSVELLSASQSRVEFLLKVTTAVRQFPSHPSHVFRPGPAYLIREILPERSPLQSSLVPGPMVADHVGHQHAREPRGAGVGIESCEGRGRPLSPRFPGWLGRFGRPLHAHAGGFYQKNGQTAAAARVNTARRQLS